MDFYGNYSFRYLRQKRLHFWSYSHHPFYLQRGALSIKHDLQTRPKLIAHLFVDRSDNLLIGNHIKSLSPTTGNRNLLRPGVNVWTDSGQAALFATPISLQVLYPSLSSLTAIELFSDDYHSTCFLAGYRSLVNSSRILQLIVTIRAHCEFDPSRSATTSIQLAQLPD